MYVYLYIDFNIKFVIFVSYSEEMRMHVHTFMSS